MQMAMNMMPKAIGITYTIYHINTSNIYTSASVCTYADGDEHDAEGVEHGQDGPREGQHDLLHRLDPPEQPVPLLYIL